MPRRLAIAALVLAALAAPAAAQLQPAEVAILAARGNAASVELAEYYAAQRGIAPERICLVDLPAGDDLPRAAWDAAVRPAIRQWLAQQPADPPVRCLVTTFGVPLRIGPAEPTAADRRYRDYLAGERAARLQRLRDVIDQLDALAPAGAITTDAATIAPAALPPLDLDDPDVPSAQLLQRFEATLDVAVKQAQQRIRQLIEGPTRAAAQSALQQLVAAVGGANVILQNMQQQLPADPNSALQLEIQRLGGAASAWAEARELLLARSGGVDRDVVLLGILERLGGQFEAVRWLDDQLERLDRGETAASFDSELALALWDDPYPLLHWHANYLRLAYEGSPLREAFPMLMVARLDAPTAELARGLVDRALAAERAGLRGVVYLDARGLPEQPNDVAGVDAANFDRALRAAAEGFRRTTSLAAVLDDQPPPFAPGACPDAALYCGWLSLGRYVDAFAWQSGAVAYHAGGAEAARLHDPQSQRWCNALLERGVAATVGAVAEPTIAAYPRPDEFFALLLRTDRTLAEAYWQTVPHASWTMILLGDPLYRPFAPGSPLGPP